MEGKLPNDGRIKPKEEWGWHGFMGPYHGGDGVNTEHENMHIYI